MQSKERIKDRVLKRAARLWGYTDSEFETSFDPLVGLLLDAISSELEKLSAEIHGSESRIIERMLEVMSPASNAGSIPSMAIIHSTPSENNFKLRLKNQLYCKKNIPNVYNPQNSITKEIFFGPTAEFILSSAEISHLALDNNLYSIPRSSYKEIYHKSENRVQNAQLWLGLSQINPGTTLKKLMFYTDIKENHQKEFFYHYLKQAKFYLGEKQIPFEIGFNVPTSQLDIDSIITKNYNRIEQIYREVNRNYHDRFLHFTQDIVVQTEDFQVPEELIRVFGSDKLNNLKDVVWLRVEFPEAMRNEVLETANFSLNCYPVINKKLLTANQAADPFINYIPMISSDHFLDVDKIRDSEGYSYHIKDFSRESLESGNASLRSNGVMRFDERNASELIQYLLELLKDESASFSVIGGDFIKKTIEEVNQLIAILEQQTKEKLFIKSSSPYVIVKPKDKTGTGNDTLYVHFWSTCGEDANGLKPGTKVLPPSGTDFIPNSAYLVTSSVGGRTRLSIQEKINSYRSSLLSHGRIVTIADIKAFTLDHFRNLISQVEVKRGTKKEVAQKSGFTRTIDVYISKNVQNDQELLESEWEYLCESYKQKLMHASSNVYPYRLYFEGVEI